MEIKHPFNYEVCQRFYVRGWCKYCGLGCDERTFETIEQVVQFLYEDQFTCYDCEQEIANEKRS